MRCLGSRYLQRSASLISIYIFPLILFPWTGEELLKVDGMEIQLLIPDRPGRATWRDTLRLYLLIIPRIGILIRNRTSVVDLRVKSVRPNNPPFSPMPTHGFKFIKAIREDRNYSKVGGVGCSTQLARFMKY